MSYNNGRPEPFGSNPFGGPNYGNQYPNGGRPEPTPGSGFVPFGGANQYLPTNPAPCVLPPNPGFAPFNGANPYGTTFGNPYGQNGSNMGGRPEPFNPHPFGGNNNPYQSNPPYGGNQYPY